MADAYNDLVWPDDPRRRPWTLERLALLDLATAREQYETHFGHATGFTFLFVGNLPDNFEDLTKRYLASLPTDDALDRPWVDRGMRPKQGQLETTVRKGTEQKAEVQLVFHTDVDQSFDGALGSPLRGAWPPSSPSSFVGSFAKSGAGCTAWGFARTGL